MHVALVAKDTLLSTVIVDAIFGYEPIKRANEYISQNTTKPPISIWHVNRQWLEVVDDANYFSPFLPELRFLCREALRGIVDIPLLCTFIPGSGVLHGALEVPEERVAKSIITMRDAWARLRPREETRPEMTTQPGLKPSPRMAEYAIKFLLIALLWSVVIRLTRPE